MALRAMGLLAASVLTLSACDRGTATKNGPGGAAPKAMSETEQAAAAVKTRFGDQIVVHDVVEDKTATGMAACGYYSNRATRSSGALFVFSDGKVVAEDDMKPDAFRDLVEHKCPDFVLRPYIPPVAANGEAV